MYLQQEGELICDEFPLEYDLPESRVVHHQIPTPRRVLAIKSIEHIGEWAATLYAVTFAYIISFDPW